MRLAERQRDAIEQLQKSIDWYDEKARKTGFAADMTSAFTKQSEALLRQKWDLQR